MEIKPMGKQIIEYTSPLDALVALVRQLIHYELKYQMTSEDFFSQYQQGRTDDHEDFVEWSGNYRHYLSLHQDLATKLQGVA